MKVRYGIALVLGLTFFISGCTSRDEVSRVTSPDGRVDAIVFENNCGAPCSFGYEVELAAKGSRRGDEVASLEGASRNEQAWGINVRSSGPDELSVEYFKADNARLLTRTVAIGGRNVAVSLHNGVKDPTAPAGGMLYNLKQRN